MQYDLAGYDWYDLIKIRDALNILIDYEIYEGKLLQIHREITHELNEIARKSLVVKRRSRQASVIS